MKQCILVIDDEEGIRHLYRTELEDAGYRVATAPDSRRALQLLGEEEVHLVVLDIRLKGESGLQLLQRLSEDYPGIPVIISSAYSSYRFDYSSWLAESYVVKSTDTSELLSEIRKILAKRGPAGRKRA